jgi:hypothetical protein
MHRFKCEKIVFIYLSLRSALFHADYTKKSLQYSLSSRSASVDALVGTFDSVLEVLYTVNIQDYTATYAGPLRKSIDNFEFVFVLTTLKQVFEHTWQFSTAQQSSDMVIDRMIRFNSQVIECPQHRFCV